MPRQSSKSSAAMVWRWNGDPHVDSWPSLSASLCASLLDDLGDYRNWKVSSKLESHAGFDLARIQSSGGFPKIRRRQHARHTGDVGAIECIGYVCKDVEIPGAVPVSITALRRGEEKRFRDIEIEGERFRTRTAISGYSGRAIIDDAVHVVRRIACTVRTNVIPPQVVIVRRRSVAVRIGFGQGPLHEVTGR